jgi:hypothetical protein
MMLQMQAVPKQLKLNTKKTNKDHTNTKGLRRRNSPTCTLSQNGYGIGSFAVHVFKLFL